MWKRKISLQWPISPLTNCHHSLRLNCSTVAAAMTSAWHPGGHCRPSSACRMCLYSVCNLQRCYLINDADCHLSGDYVYRWQIMICHLCPLSYPVLKLQSWVSGSKKVSSSVKPQFLFYLFMWRFCSLRASVRLPVSD